LIEVVDARLLRVEHFAKERSDSLDFSLGEARGPRRAVDQSRDV